MQATPNGDRAEVATRERELLAKIAPDTRDHGLEAARARAAARLLHQPVGAIDNIDAVAEIRRALASRRETQP